jgi:acetylornithine deacetylase/succinyl-diaminopimelate desuccinylase-like protein
MPTIGDNAVPHLGELLARVGRGLPGVRSSPPLDHTLSVLLGQPPTGSEQAFVEAMERACNLHPSFEHALPPLAGTTMAPTLLTGSKARNVMPARASVELDCRVLPDTTPAEVMQEVRERLGNDIRYELDFPEGMTPGSASPVDGRLPAAVAATMATLDPEAVLLPILDIGYTDSSFLRAAAGTAAYGFSPFCSTPIEVLDAGYHNADERVHVDDLLLAVDFHLDLARRLLG